jgi:hypothetical protein
MKYLNFYSLNKKCIDCKKIISNEATRCHKCKSKGKNNPMYGKKHTEKSLKIIKEKTIEKTPRGKNHPRWVGAIPKNKTTVHFRVYSLYGKANKCENPLCEGKSVKYDWSNKDHKYDSLDRKKWKMLCHKCHEEYDILENNKYV